jgi:hypothetical protein
MAGNVRCTSETWDIKNFHCEQLFSRLVLLYTCENTQLRTEPLNWLNMTAPVASERSLILLSRRQIEGLIADGKSIVIVDQTVLKVDPWLKYHPGGDKAILHMVGRDATDEVNGYLLTPHFGNSANDFIGFTPQKQERKWKDIVSVE